MPNVFHLSAEYGTHTFNHGGSVAHQKVTSVQWFLFALWISSKAAFYFQHKIVSFRFSKLLEVMRLRSDCKNNSFILFYFRLKFSHLSTFSLHRAMITALRYCTSLMVITTFYVLHYWDVKVTEKAGNCQDSFLWVFNNRFHTLGLLIGILPSSFNCTVLWGDIFFYPALVVI